MSWREFRFNLRPISLLAVGCVAFTTVAFAAATHWLLGFGWPVGFVVGAIVSPPDAVAPLSMLRLRRWVNDPRIEITLSILTPFLAYWPPHKDSTEEAGWSQDPEKLERPLPDMESSIVTSCTLPSGL